MSSDARKIVQEYLHKNGFSFEMKVARELSKVGLGITQSLYYQDPITEISREIDVLGMYHKTIQGIAFNVFFIIECKYAQTPWILFTSELGLGNGKDYYCSNSEGKRWRHHLYNQPEFNNFFEIKKRRGYGLTVATRNDDEQVKNNAHRAIQTILSFLKSEAKNQTLHRHKSYNVFIPIIAIKGKLFEAFLNDKNEEICNEIREGQLFYKEEILDGIIPKIHIVTNEYLESYALKIKSDCDRMFNAPFFSEGLINDYPNLSGMFY